jgi:hypothetical protein
MAKSIIFYEDCDVYHGDNNIERLGFDKTTSFGSMIDKAIEHKCNIIIKNGNGKWYLKGLDKDPAVSKERIESNLGKYPRVKCWLIEFA